MEEAAKIVNTDTKSKTKSKPIINRILDFFSSVRFGVTLLVILVVLSIVGMVVVQQNVSGFDGFFASLMPAEKLAFGTLGFFDIYHSWYYNLLLLILSLNIVLASIDRFPSAWKYISEPKLWATREWLLEQSQNAIVQTKDSNEKSIAEKIKQTFEKNNLKTRITEETLTFYATDEQGKKVFDKIESKTYHFVFGEKGRWNRMGAYIVHVSLLLLFLGHFVALQTGFDADVQFELGQKTNQIQIIQFNLDKQERYSAQLPFTITATDIQQKLIDPRGSIEINNTMDWRTQIKIDDPQYGETVADVSLNKPFSYRGYRFFQASAITVGAARRMTLEFTPENGGQPVKVELARNGETSLPDGTKIKFEQFWSDFVAGQPESPTNEYQNPAVKIKLLTANNQSFDAYAFANQLPGDAPIGKAVGGYKIKLVEYEKSPFAHVLSIKYDPYSGHFIAWYLGGFGLMFALVFVFFIAHQRIWALIDGDNVVLGGNTNRNHLAFDDKFKKIVNDLQ